MDIHRCRFIPYPASSINAVAFSHELDSQFPNNQAGSSVRLAVGRENGDIEIWNPHKGHWSQESVFKGGNNRTIQGLLWTQDPPDVTGNSLRPGRLRLFSIGYSSAVTEWDLSTGLPRKNWSHTDTTAAWCFAAQPRLKFWENGQPVKQKQILRHGSQHIAVGHADGSIILLSTADDDLQFVKYLARPTSKKLKVLSLAFQNHHNGRLVAGFSDSTIRVYGLTRTQPLVCTISLGSAPQGHPKAILVWTLKALPNGDIVSGDSTGDIRIFDSKTWSEKQRLSGHDNDILNLAVAQSRRYIFSAGMDRRTARYGLPGPHAPYWVKSYQRSYHNHEVKALALYEGQGLNVVVSGGVDSNLAIMPFEHVDRQYHYMTSGLPHRSPIACAKIGRLIASWWEREIHIWSFSPPRGEKNTQRLVSKIVLSGDEYVSDVSFDTGANFIAIATASDVKVFRLVLNIADDPSRPKLHPTKIAELKGQGARLIQFSENGKWLAFVTVENEVKMVKWTDWSGLDVTVDTRMTRMKLPFVRSGTEERKNQIWGPYLNTISRMIFSPDGNVLVASDLSGGICVWAHHESLRNKGVSAPQMTDANSNGGAGGGDGGADDNASNHSDDSDESDEHEDVGWGVVKSTQLLPKVRSAVTTMVFRPSDDCYHLMVLDIQHRLVELDLLSGGLTSWGRKNARNALLPGAQENMDRAKGSFAGVDGWMWFYGAQWLAGFDANVEHDAPPKEAPKEAPSGQVPRGKKRKREEAGAGGKMKREEIQGLMYREEKTSVALAGVKTDVEFEDLSDSDGDFEPFDPGEAGGSRNNGELATGSTRPKTQHLELKYRPILGIVPFGPLQKEQTEEAVHDQAEPVEQERSIEVVLIERPEWDMDFADRYERRYE